MHDEKSHVPEKIKKVIFIILVVMALLALIGIVYREIEFLILKSATKKQSVMNVLTTTAVPSPTPEAIVLPGFVEAWHDATMYARTNGYIVEWKVDIGAKVKTGDLLALISAPEVNAQLRQAEADLKTAEENYTLAKITAARWVNLVKTASVSKQETDEKVLDAKAKKAILVAARANRDKLKDLVSFQRVIAPFDGIIASRNTDVGRLINAGSGAKQPLFRVVQSDPLRVYVRVPQSYAARITPDLQGELTFPDYPGRSWHAKLLDTAKAVDPATKTLLIQLVCDNHEYEILPGAFVKVHLSLPVNKRFVRLPINTLLFRSQGLQVATIDGDHKVVLKSVVINRDFGDFVEIASGVNVDEAVILNPADSLASGQEVHVNENLQQDKVTL
jgi:RND family efflux transporter MFP subunit